VLQCVVVCRSFSGGLSTWHMQYGSVCCSVCCSVAAFLEGVLHGLM